MAAQLRPELHRTHAPVMRSQDVVFAMVRGYTPLSNGGSAPPPLALAPHHASAAASLLSARSAPAALPARPASPPPEPSRQPPPAGDAATASSPPAPQQQQQRLRRGARTAPAPSQPPQAAPHTGAQASLPVGAAYHLVRAASADVPTHDGSSGAAQQPRQLRQRRAATPPPLAAAACSAAQDDGNPFNAPQPHTALAASWATQQQPEQLPPAPSRKRALPQPPPPAPAAPDPQPPPPFAASRADAALLLTGGASLQQDWMPAGSAARGRRGAPGGGDGGPSSGRRAEEEEDEEAVAAAATLAGAARRRFAPAGDGGPPEPFLGGPWLPPELAHTHQQLSAIAAGAYPFLAPDAATAFLPMRLPAAHVDAAAPAHASGAHSGPWSSLAPLPPPWLGLALPPQPHHAADASPARAAGAAPAHAAAFAPQVCGPPPPGPVLMVADGWPAGTVVAHPVLHHFGGGALSGHALPLLPMAPAGRGSGCLQGDAGRELGHQPPPRAAGASPAARPPQQDSGGTTVTAGRSLSGNGGGGASVGGSAGVGQRAAAAVPWACPGGAGGGVADGMAMAAAAAAPSAAAASARFVPLRGGASVAAGEEEGSAGAWMEQEGAARPVVVGPRGSAPHFAPRAMDCASPPAAPGLALKMAGHASAPASSGCCDSPHRGHFSLAQILGASPWLTPSPAAVGAPRSRDTLPWATHAEHASVPPGGFDPQAHHAAAFAVRAPTAAPLAPEPSSGSWERLLVSPSTTAARSLDRAPGPRGAAPAGRGFGPGPASTPCSGAGGVGLRAAAGREGGGGAAAVQAAVASCVSDALFGPRAAVGPAPSWPGLPGQLPPGAQGGLTSPHVPGTPVRRTVVQMLAPP